MKSYLFALTTLCLLSTGFDSSVDAQDDFNYVNSEQAGSISTYLTQNINSNPQSAEDYFNRGVIYYKSGQNEKALADFNQTITLNPNDAKAYYNRGVMYYKIGNISRCKKDLEKASILFRQQEDTQMYSKIIQILQKL